MLLQYKTERDGVEETHVVQKVVVSGDDEDDFDFDSVSSFKI